MGSDPMPRRDQAPTHHVDLIPPEIRQEAEDVAQATAEARRRELELAAGAYASAVDGMGHGRAFAMGGRSFGLQIGSGPKTCPRCLQAIHDARGPSPDLAGGGLSR